MKIRGQWTQVGGDRASGAIWKFHVNSHASLRASRKGWLVKTVNAPLRRWFTVNVTGMPVRRNNDACRHFPAPAHLAPRSRLSTG